MEKLDHIIKWRLRYGLANTYVRMKTRTPRDERVSSHVRIHNAEFEADKTVAAITFLLDDVVSRTVFQTKMQMRDVPPKLL